MDNNIGNNNGNELLFKILDADTMKEKLEIMRLNRYDIDRRMLGNIAAALDVICNSDDADGMFDEIEQYLLLRMRFETDRRR